jgi:hypothetical protein
MSIMANFEIMEDSAMQPLIQTAKHEITLNPDQPATAYRKLVDMLIEVKDLNSELDIMKY